MKKVTDLIPLIFRFLGRTSKLESKVKQKKAAESFSAAFSSNFKLQSNLFCAALGPFRRRLYAFFWNLVLNLVRQLVQCFIALRREPCSLGRHAQPLRRIRRFVERRSRLRRRHLDRKST